MAKPSKSKGGTAAKSPKSSGGSNNLLLLGVVAAGAAYFMLNKSGSDTTTTGTNTSSSYDNTPIDPRNVQVNTGTSVQTSTPTSVQHSTPTSVQTSTGTTTQTTTTTPSGPILDVFGIPHLHADTVDWANGFGPLKSNLFKSISDQYGLYAEEIEALMVLDQSNSGNPWDAVFRYWTTNIGIVADLIAFYNTRNPTSPITRRA